MKGRVLWMVVLCVGSTLLAESPFSDIRFHGYLSQGFLVSNTHDYIIETQSGTFQVNEFALNFSKELNDNISFGGQFFSRYFGDFGQQEVLLDWALVDFHKYDALGIRLGKIKLPAGLYNEGRDADLLRNSIFLPQTFYVETRRDFTLAFEGGEAYGHMPFGLDYKLFVGSIRVDVDNPGIEDYLQVLANQQPYTNASIDFDWVAGGQLAWDTPIEGLHLRYSDYRASIDVSFHTAPAESHTFRVQNLVGQIVSLMWTRGNFQFSSEYFIEAIDLLEIPDEAFDQEGYFAWITYRLSDRWELGSYYSVFYPDRHDHGGQFYRNQGLPRALAWQKDLTLSLRLDLNEHWIIKFEGHALDGLAHALDDTLDLFETTETSISEKWQLWAIKTTFHF